MPRQSSRRKSDKPYRATANLDILFGDEETTPPQTLKLAFITLPPQQPRRYFDPEKLAQLTESVKTHGILENLLVRPLPNQEGRYELVAGERRYRAARAAGLESVPVTIRNLSDEEALLCSLMENLQREDLNPVEETEGILQLLSFRLQIPETEVVSWLYRLKNANARMKDNVILQPPAQEIVRVFEELGHLSWESFATNRLPLLKLPQDILTALETGRIAYTKAKAIASLKDPQQRQDLLAAAIRDNLSLRQIRERIQALSVPPLNSPKKRITSLTHRLQKSQLWEKDPKKWQRVQNWLGKIEKLLEADV